MASFSVRWSTVFGFTTTSSFLVKVSSEAIRMAKKKNKTIIVRKKPAMEASMNLKNCFIYDLILKLVRCKTWFRSGNIYD
ncbi:hypothetical protein DSECCO2_656270 [anaerobic digester metagenome]